VSAEYKPRRRREQFAAALKEARVGASLSQKALGERCGVSQAAVGLWEAAANEPSPDMVWSIEKCLALGPGTLSRHLGYLPADEAPSFEAAVDADPLLLPVVKRSLIAFYRQAIAVRNRRGRQ
jgi:transcriptional regulator with XRE-family HTH domain